jgi:ribosomal protein L24E
MNPTDVSSPTPEASTCFSCGKEIVDGHWFARLKQGSQRVIFCRPHCVEVYLQQSVRAVPEWTWASPSGV